MSTTTLSSTRAPLAPGSPTKIGFWKSLPSICTSAHAGLFEVDADEAAGGPFEDVDDAAFELAHAAALFELHGDDVAARGVAGLVHGDEDVGVAAFGTLRAFGADEAEAGGGAAEGAGEMVRWVGAFVFFEPRFAHGLQFLGWFFCDGNSLVDGRVDWLAW